MSERTYRVAMLCAGDPRSRATLKLEETRLGGIARRCAPSASTSRLRSTPTRSPTECASSCCASVDPVCKDGNRATLDPLLRDVASHGVFVSAHPDLILKMGTKEVLYRTHHMSWGTDTRLYTTLEQFRCELPQCLAEGKARVLKQYRGNGGLWHRLLEAGSWGGV